MIATDEDLRWLVRRILGVFDAKAIYLFGSHAKGLAGAGSDVDLLVVGPSRLPRPHRGREVLAAISPFGGSVDVLFYTEAELAEERSDPYSFIASVLSTARPLYERAVVGPQLGTSCVRV